MDDCKDEKCPHPKGLCKLRPTHEVTPNGYNIVQDKNNAFFSHVLQFHDPMKEFKSLLKKLKKDASQLDIVLDLSNCIENFENSHTEQNRPVSIDIGEPLPWILQEQAK